MKKRIIFLFAFTLIVLAFWQFDEYQYRQERDNSVYLAVVANRPDHEFKITLSAGYKPWDLVLEKYRGKPTWLQIREIIEK